MKSMMRLATRAGLSTLTRSVASGSMMSQSLVLRQSPSLGALARARYGTAAETELRGKLETQIAEETDIAKKNLEGREAPSVPGFQVSTDEAESQQWTAELKVKLTKSLDNGQSLTVTFNVNHSVDSDSEGPEDPPQGDKSDEVFMTSRPSFTVEIGGEGQKLVFECQQTADQNEDADAFTIDEIYLFSGELSEKVYATSGPIIDETIYDGLMNYLEERGIDGEFVDHLTELATHYEHAQYVALLKKLKDFVAN